MNKQRFNTLFHSIQPADVLFAFCLLLGRIPFWVMLLALIADKPANPMGIAYLFPAAVIARGFLFAYEYQISFNRGIFRSLFLYILRPAGWLICIEIVYIALAYLLLFGEYRVVGGQGRHQKAADVGAHDAG